MKEKKQIMKEQLGYLYHKLSYGEILNDREQMAFDIYSWILDDTDAPSID